jgi:hypothetical protein
MRLGGVHHDTADCVFRAECALQRLLRVLAIVNEPAAWSLEKALEDTLTLHRLNDFPDLGVRGGRSQERTRRHCGGTPKEEGSAIDRLSLW